MEKFALYFILFITYSFIGWVVEIINELIYNKRVINRGFLIGPYCPIYGFGAIIMISLLRDNSDLIGTFLKAMVICAFLEYMTSYIMEVLFKTRWWDYSNKKFNINGRICLETLVLFGMGGCLLMYIVNPFLVGLCSKVPDLILIIISVLLFIIFITDFIISFNTINSFKNTVILKKDSTAEVSKRVRKILNDRLAKAFPNIKELKKNNL